MNCKARFTLGFVIECVVFDNDSYVFHVRQPNGQPLAVISDEDDLVSYISDLRDNVIAKHSSESQDASIVL